MGFELAEPEDKKPAKVQDAFDDILEFCKHCDEEYPYEALDRLKRCFDCSPSLQKNARRIERERKAALRMKIKGRK